ncbi:MAG: hypothetical protein AAB563_01085 [Patescibacteria group bacterium]
MVTVTMSNDASHSITQFTASLYRSASLNSRYGSPVASATTDGSPNYAKLTDNPPAGQYTYFVLVTIPAGQKDCSEESARYDTAAGGSYGNWFTSVDSVVISIDESASDIPPPYVKLGGKSDVNRPELKFVLSETVIEGSTIVNAGKWLFFSANQVSSGGALTPIDGLYFVTSDDANNNYFVSAPGSSATSIVSSGLKDTNPIVLKKVGIDDKYVIRVFDYLMNVPKNGTYNCQGGDIYLTGPSSTDGKTVTDVRRNNSGAMTNPGSPPTFSQNSSGLNQNCLSSTGWSAKWGVKNTDVTGLLGGGPCGINNIVSGEIGKIITKIVACTVKYFMTVVGSITNYAKEAGNETVQIETQLRPDYKDVNGKESGLVTAWKYSLGLINILVILALLAIAFANISPIKISNYIAKKSLPGLLLGVIGANASLLIVRFILDVVQALSALAYQIAPATNLADLVGKFIGILGGGLTSINPTLLGILALFIVIFAVVYFVVLIVLVSIAFIKRLVMLYFLVIIAPLAFVSFGIPSMQQWFTKWWNTFLQQAFVLPILLLAMAFFIQYGDKLGLKVDLGLSGAAGEQTANTTSILFTVLAFVAASMILKLPSAITKGSINLENAAKNALGIAKTASGVSAAQGFAKKKWEDTKTDVSERAKLRLARAYGGTALGRYSARIKAKRNLDKENMKKDVELLGKAANIHVLKGKAGASKAYLAEREKILADNEGTVLARHEITAFAKEAKERLTAEFEKREQESLKNKGQSEAKLEFISTGKEDKTVKDLVNRVFTNSFDEKRASQEMELQESIKVGGVARDKIEILRAADNYRRHKEEFDSLSKEEQTAEGGRGEMLKTAMNEELESFAAMQANEKYEKEFGQKDKDGKYVTTIETVGKQLKEANTAEGRTWKATLGQGRKIFNDGVMKQGELLVKEGSVGEFKRELEDYLGKFSTEVFGEKAGEMKKLFQQGKTAKLQVMIDQHKVLKEAEAKAQGKEYKYEGPDMRDGLVITEALKKVATMNSDYRNADILKLMDEHSGQPPKISEQDLVDLKKSQADRRKMAFEIINTGPYSGVPDIRLQRGFMPDTKNPEPIPIVKVAPPPPPTSSQADVDATPATGGSGTKPQTIEEWEAQHGMTAAEWQRQFGNQAANQPPPAATEPDLDDEENAPESGPFDEETT